MLSKGIRECFFIVGTRSSHVLTTWASITTPCNSRHEIVAKSSSRIENGIIVNRSEDLAYTRIEDRDAIISLVVCKHFTAVAYENNLLNDKGFDYIGRLHGYHKDLAERIGVNYYCRIVDFM